MSNRRKPKSIKPTVRNGGIRLAAHGVRRTDPDFSRILQATLDHYTCQLEVAPDTRSVRSGLSLGPGDAEVDDECA